VAASNANGHAIRRRFVIAPVCPRLAEPRLEALGAAPS
jgi:hypothetical protein